MDLSHGHPPSLSSRSGRRSQQSSHVGADPSTPPSLSSQTYDQPFSLQNRRLQLRNVGFRGPKVSSQRRSVRLPRFFAGAEILQSEPAPVQKQDENLPHNQSPNHTRSNYRPPTTLGILQEISNSTRNRYSQKRVHIPVTDDNPQRPLLDLSPAVATPGSWYHDASSTQQSPLTFHSADAEFDTMRLREISGNERRSPPPLSSPLARQVRGRKKRGLDLRRTTFGASEYIEHIENELQQVKESMHSPNTGKPLRDKLRILQTENKQVKDSIFHLEETFDERVKQAMEHKAAVEMDLRRQINILEDELVMKENIIINLEHDREEAKYDSSSIEALRTVIERLELEKERLEESNRVVEKRNEALTGLLAQSPTRSHGTFELPSPVRLDSRRTPRPKSIIIPKLSSSPQSSNHQCTQSGQVSPERPPAGYFSPDTALELDVLHRHNDSQEADLRKGFDNKSLDSGLGESCFVRSPPRGRSRRSSIASHASASPTAWGMPPQISPSNDRATARQSKHRRTRRFESGSTQLKPLLLPTMAAESNIFQPAYTPIMYSSPTRREFSEQSLDPTVAFLSEPFEMPVQRPALPSKWGSETARRALEGSSPPHFERFDDIIAQNDGESALSTSSPIQGEILGQVDEVHLQESDSPGCVDDTILAGDFAAIHNQETKATNETVFSSLNRDASSPAPDPHRDTSREQKSISSKVQSEPVPLPELQRSNGFGLYSNDTSLGHKSGVCSQELIPEPLFLPSASQTTTSASLNYLSRKSRPTMGSCDQDDSPIPRKRQRSSNPDNCSSVVPTLCVNPSHSNGGHERSVSDTHVSPPTCVSPEPVSRKPQSRPRSPPERLHRATTSPVPLTSVTICTIFGTLSRYTSYMREIRRDPTALARRVIANTWHSNWKRLGKLSWWVLGLFLGPGTRAGRLGTAQGTFLDWDRYDGEAIAHEVCAGDIGIAPQEQAISAGDLLQGPSNLRAVRFDDSDPGYRTEGTKTKAKPALKHGPRKRTKDKISWGKSLYLWGKFSVAILLAVGGAVVSGPDEMLRDCAERVHRRTPSISQEHMAGTLEGREMPGEEQTNARAGETPVIEGMAPTDGQNSPIQEQNLMSQARDVSDGSARSFSGAGAGSMLGMVKLGRSSLKTPSPARRRRRELNHDFTVEKNHTFGPPYGNEVNEGWNPIGDNDNGKRTLRGIIKDSRSGNPVLSLTKKTGALDDCNGYGI